jgi:hypothetical protein
MMCSCCRVPAVVFPMQTVAPVVVPEMARLQAPAICTPPLVLGCANVSTLL